jgi:2-iminoacetate synthase ThiH
MRILDPRQLSYKIVVGKVPSLNAFYASRHWTARVKAKELTSKEVMSQLEKYDLEQITDVHILCRVNYRYDIDNAIMAVKFALDAFKTWGGVKDDSRAYVQSLKMVHDKTITKDTAEITFTGMVVSE